MIDLMKLDSPGGWAKVREEIQKAILAVLGKLPKERMELQLNIVDEEDFPGYVRQRVTYFVDDWTRVSAWLFIPEGAEGAPGILCCHQEGGPAKEESAGIRGHARLAFARHYAERGFVTLAPDSITAGERVSSRLEPYDTKLFYKDNPKMSAVGKMFVDHAHALDVFDEITQADTERLGVIGHGMGGTNALLLAALDDRVAACVASCGFTRFESDEEPERWAPDTGLVLLPGLREHIERGVYPFDWEHVLALAAPSATLIITSLHESNYHHPESCGEAVEHARKAYKLLGAAKAIGHYTHKDGHRVSFETLDAADEWFDRWL